MSGCLEMSSSTYLGFLHINKVLFQSFVQLPWKDILRIVFDEKISVREKVQASLTNHWVFFKPCQGVYGMESNSWEHEVSATNVGGCLSQFQIMALGWRGAKMKDGVKSWVGCRANMEGISMSFCNWFLADCLTSLCLRFFVSKMGVKLILWNRNA